MSWFWRGFQSAIFYYVSCAPCTKLAYRRKRRQESHRAKAEKAQFEAEQPDLYRHPSPFSTNAYWMEDIVLGPGPPGKHKDKDKEKGRGESSRGLASAGRESNRNKKSHDTLLNVDGENDGMGQHLNIEDGWNRKRYEREDEPLWGFEDVDGNFSTYTPNMEYRPTDSHGSRAKKAPPLKDPAPPIVNTKLLCRDEVKWMLQPPPKAKIMEGKERPPRSRSTSGASKPSIQRSVDNSSLRRKRTESPTENRDRRRNEPLASLTRIKSEGSSKTDARGQRHDRDPPTSNDSLPPGDSTKKHRPSPISISEDHSSTIQFSFSLPQAQTDGAAPMKLPLSTIESSSTIVPTLPYPPPIKSPPAGLTKTPSHLCPLVLSADSTSSLHILQELVAPSSALNFRSQSPITEAIRTKLPGTSSEEDSELRLPECESWWPGSEFRFSSENLNVRDFAKGNGGVGRRVDEFGGRKRWSMDI